MDNGMIHVYTGPGKGKTTCAAGLCLRASGRGYRILWTSFLKSYDSGEFLGHMPFTLYKGRPVSGFFPDMREEERAAVREEHLRRLSEVFSEAEKGGYDMLVLDEACTAVSVGALDEGLLISLLKARPENLDVVLTGRDAGAALLKTADYVSEIGQKSHPYKNNSPARPGIEY